jgi:SecD/SecF fusion protein
MGFRKFAFAVSGVLMVFGLIACAEIVRGHANLGVDFTGGSMLQYKAEKAFSLEEVRRALTNGGFAGVDLQQVTNEDRLIVKMKTAMETIGDESDQITAILVNELADTGFSMESKSEIGASISADLRNKAILSIALSMLGVVLYLAMRFDVRFGVAATITTFHDVLVAVGICWLLDKEITLLIVTALLTLAGYSLNDTVVVFDRIRENMRKDENLTLVQVINDSINQTLSRSIITTLTLLFTVASLFFFGGTAIHDFSFVLLIGLVVGMLSTIFIASPLLTLKWGKHS